MNKSSSNTHSILVDPAFRTFVESEVLPKTNVSAEHFWNEVESIVNEFAPRNETLLNTRSDLQSKINKWHNTHDYDANDLSGYKAFLKQIGYLLDEGDDFALETSNIDPEISTIAGPQLVVPLKNARFALNAANARWGNLYDALYGSNVIEQSGELKAGDSYNPQRGAEVIKYGRELLDKCAPLEKGSHSDVTQYQIYYQQMVAILDNGDCVGLNEPAQFVGYNGSKNHPTQILLKHNGLHLEIAIDPNSQVGSTDKAHVEGIKVEAALTTIMDCEDSVAAVDTEDKIEVYRNWLGLMCGTLEKDFKKNGVTVKRNLQFDRVYTSRNGEQIRLPGRSLLLIRNVGQHMYNSLVTLQSGQQIPEAIIDGIVTTLIAMIDLDIRDTDDLNIKNNSRAGSIYIVKPKMHGPEEVQYTCDLFTRIEQAFGLQQHTIKLGIMDEERRTTLNLKECIRVAKHRCFFINTGFLDRTGDEIHTSTQAGSFLPKDELKGQPWLSAYEDWNVDIGLTCGFTGKAQIGKGMWAMPDEMKRMMDEKISHPQAGASTAWVPSPTAAVLHALHYHMVDVQQQQQTLRTRPRANINDLLTLPLMADQNSLNETQIQRELENSIQGILGYVVRWVEQGVGCSKVPDINHVGLMEDRATLRISSQHLANWLLHGVCTEKQIEEVMLQMSSVVDEQNKFTVGYVAMNPNPQNSLAFQASKDLILKGTAQENGYTEAVLHHYRILAKSTPVVEQAANTIH